MRQKIRTKKIRGWKNKQRFAGGIVSHITAKGFWLRVSGKDYFIPRSEHRLFRSASIAESLDVVVDKCDDCTEDDFYLKWKKLKISTRIVRTLYSFFFFSAEKNEPPHVHMRDMLDGAQAVNVSKITENGFWFGLRLLIDSPCFITGLQGKHFLMPIILSLPFERGEASAVLFLSVSKRYSKMMHSASK